MKNTMVVPYKMKKELPYDPAIPLLGVYLKKTIIWKDECIFSMFTVALFAMAKTWKQSNVHGQKNGLIRGSIYMYMWCTHTHKHTHIYIYTQTNICISVVV